MEYQEVVCNHTFAESDKLKYQVGAFRFISNIKDGLIATEVYTLNGEWHRENGPAIIIHQLVKDYEEYWLYNIKFSQEEYYQQLKLKLYW